MVKTRAVFFWMTGVITPNLLTLATRALANLGKPEANLLALPGWSWLVQGLACGQVDGPAFCTAICQQCGLVIPAGELERQILAQLTPGSKVLETINLLPEAYERWLVVDLPRAWLDAAAGRVGLEPSFQAGRQVVLPESGLAETMPAALDYLAGKAHIPLAEGLLIDASNRRAVQALRHGMQAAIFLDARRLEREFILRYFIDRPQPAHKPN